MTLLNLNKITKIYIPRDLLVEFSFFIFCNNFACHDYLCQNFFFVIETLRSFLGHSFCLIEQTAEKQFYSTEQLFSTLREESVCGRNFCGSVLPQIFAFYGKKLSRFYEIRSFAGKKLLRFTKVTIFSGKKLLRLIEMKDIFPFF